MKSKKTAGQKQPKKLPKAKERIGQGSAKQEQEALQRVTLLEELSFEGKEKCLLLT